MIQREGNTAFSYTVDMPSKEAQAFFFMMVGCYSIHNIWSLVVIHSHCFEGYSTRTSISEAQPSFWIQQLNGPI
jgi:hypothetical protein